MSLALICYGGNTLHDYTPLLSELRMMSVAPGGFSQLRARFELPPPVARVPRPEFAVLSGRVAVMDGHHCCFTGEIIDAAHVMDKRGEGIEIVAQGGAGALADDPLDSTYTSTTAQAILLNQMSVRSAYLAIDNDTAEVLPTNPSTTFSPVFDGKTFEDVLHEVMDLLGDYVWGVWDHPTHKDAYGLPTWQLVAHPRDDTTPGWTASIGEVVAWRVAPSYTRAYNGVTIHYLDPKLGPKAVTVSDPRLGVGFAQGTAPFRFRRFRRDMGARSLTATQATALANQYLAEFENVANVISVTLGGVRNAQGLSVPLWRVRADTNIAIPELLPRAAVLPGVAGFVQGSNLFYIRQAEYIEKKGSAPQLDLLLDQIADFASADLTRQKYLEQLRLRSKKTSVAVQPGGLAMNGFFSVRWGAASGAGNVWGGDITFPAVFSSAPAAVTFTAISSSNVASGPTADNLTVWGCDVTVTASLAGAGYWIGTYSAL